MVATKTSKNLIALTFSLTFTLLALTFSGCSKNEEAKAIKEIRIYTWSDYLQDSMIKSFEKESGLTVKLDYFSSNEELLAKIQASVQSGSAGYDLIMPSDYMVATMVELKLLRELDHGQLPFVNDYAPEFKNPSYDQGLKHSVPVAWGTTGLAVDTSKIKNFSRSQGISWKDVFENKAYSGQVSMLDDMKEVFHAALLVLGKKWSEATKEDITAAFQYIKKHKASIKIFTAESRPVMEAGECTLCQAYSGDVLKAQKTRASLDYLIPKEGATLWTDNFAIPNNAKNPSGAYQFLSYFLGSAGAKQFTESTFFASPNQKARMSLIPELQANNVIFPSENDMKRLSLIQEKPELMLLIDQYWTELRSE